MKLYKEQIYLIIGFLVFVLAILYQGVFAYLLGITLLAYITLNTIEIVKAYRDYNDR